MTRAYSPKRAEHSSLTTFLLPLDQFSVRLPQRRHHPIILRGTASNYNLVIHSLSSGPELGSHPQSAIAAVVFFPQLS